MKKKVSFATSSSGQQQEEKPTKSTTTIESTPSSSSKGSKGLNLKSLASKKKRKLIGSEDDEPKKPKYESSISIVDKLRNKILSNIDTTPKGKKFIMDPFASLLKVDVPSKIIEKLNIDDYKLNLPKYHFKTNNPVFIEYRTNDLSDNSYQKLCVCIDFDKKAKDVWFHHFYRPWESKELKEFIETSTETKVVETINDETPNGDKALVLGDIIQFIGTKSEDELNSLYRSFTKEEQVKRVITTSDIQENDKLDDILLTETDIVKFQFKDEDTPVSLGPTSIMEKLKRDKSYTLNELLVEDDLIRKWKDYLQEVQGEDDASRFYNQKTSLRSKIKSGSTYSNPKSTTPLTHFRDDFQGRLFTIMNDYRDLYFPNCSLDNHRVCVETYTLHIVNHLLKTKRYEWYNDTKREFYSKEQYTIKDDSYNTSKILVIVPNRFVAFLIVELISELVPKLLSTRRKEAFELTFDADEEDEELKKSKPLWWQKIFEGNTNEEFSLGLKLKDHHGQLEIMAPVAESDIIIATPIGIQQENISDRYERFLSSIEVCIIDQCDKLLMQNWEHVTKTLDLLNIEEQQKFTFDLDFDVLKEYHIQGLSKYFRQTIIFSSQMSPDINGLVSKYCKNFRGVVKVRSLYDGVIGSVFGQIPQIFERIPTEDPAQVDEDRYNHFVNSVFPRFKNSVDGRFLLVVSSYLDFVRLRNFFDMCNIPFHGISEYTEKTKNVLTKFRQDCANFLVYTERHFYYHAPKLSDFKINQIVYYSLPENAFIYEIFAKKAMNIRAQYPSCRILSLFSTFDALKLERIVGTKRCKHLLTADTDINLIDK